MKKQVILFFIAITVMNLRSQTFQWAKSFSGTGTERSNGVVVDALGNVYTAGPLMGTADFDPGAGTYTLSAPAGGAFISKLDGNGNFVWAKAITASGGCYINAITLDASGNVLTTGGFQNTIDLDPGAGVDYQTASSNNDVFVSKLDGNGNFVWGRIFGGGGVEWGDGITTDATGDIYITGNFGSTNMDFDPSAASNTVSTSGGADIFINKLSSSGNFVWGKKMGGTGPDYGKGIKVDAAMNVYITGYFNAIADFDPSLSATYTIAAGGQDAFVSKLDASGNFVWAKNLGGAATEAAYAIELDAAGNVITTGNFNGTGDYDPGAGTFNLNNGGTYISKLDNTGNFVWARQLGGFGCYSYAIAVDATGNIFTTGILNLTGDFDPGAGTATLSSTGGNDVFVSELDATGNYLWAGSMGSALTDNGYGIFVKNNDVYVTGYYNDIGDFDITSGTFTLAPAGGYDAFVTKFNLSPSSASVKELQEKEAVQVFPNPNNGVFQIGSSVQFTSVRIYDQLGALVIDKLADGSSTSINISDAAKGVYFYQILNKGEMVKTGKIVIE